VCATEYLEGLGEIAGVGERLAVGAEQAPVVRMLDRCLLQHRRGLRALAERAQCRRIADGGFRAVRMGAVERARGVDLSPRLAIACGKHRGRRSDAPRRVRRRGRLQGLAAGCGEGEQDKRERSEGPGGRKAGHDLVQPSEHARRRSAEQ